MTNTPANLAFFQDILLQWFTNHGRKFPWRNETDPYRILIAEIMLQRTRASQVESVYVDFMKRFCDIDSVIMSKQEVISSFRSLGLPVRGQRIVDLSLILRKNYCGQVPQGKEELKILPSVGEYVAEAVRVFAFGKRGTVIDTNVVRIISRFFGLEAAGELRRNAGLMDICKMLSSCIGESEIKKLNWALLDFGALICKPCPLCDRCPLTKMCNYFKKKQGIDSVMGSGK